MRWEMMRLFKSLSKLSFSYRFRFLHVGEMACSRFEYVKKYEMPDIILPNVWIVVRVDGKGFKKFSQLHNFEKPNDLRALNLMNAAAVAVMHANRDIVVSFGQSDEYSFVFRKNARIYNRRSSKILSYVTSLFTSSYVMQWSRFFNTSCPLKCAPSFDGRVVLYPSDNNLRDYLSWRQADVHINNLYNTAFWKLVQEGGNSNQEATVALSNTLSAHKHELLFSKFDTNYNDLPAIYRKGTILLRKSVTLGDGQVKQLIVPIHDDLIRDNFWKKHKELLADNEPGDYEHDASGELPELIKMQESLS